VLADAEGEEITRLLDYAPPTQVAAFLDSARAQPAPIKELLKKLSEKSDDPKANAILGERLFHLGRFQESVHFLEKVQPSPARLPVAKTEAARVEFEKDPKQKDNYVSNLRRAITAEPSSTRSIKWRTEILPLVEGEERVRTYQEGKT